MNVKDQLALLGYAEMLDDTVEVPGMRGGEPVRILMNETQRLESEIVRLKIAHLRRMADVAAAWAILSASEPGARNLDAYALTPRKLDKLHRFHSACLAKITELKESQCSTKS